MDPIRLAQIAAQAEMLRLRALARRQAGRVMLALIAVLFLLPALAGGHVALVMALTDWTRPLWAVLIVSGIDLSLALVFALLASRDRPSRAEREALALREQVRRQLLVETFFSALSRILRR